MGQGNSIPVEHYDNLAKAYKSLILHYDVVNDELNELYADYDASGAALMRKHGNISKLGSRFDHNDQVASSMTEEDLKASAVNVDRMYNSQARRRKYGGSTDETIENLDALKRSLEEKQESIRKEREKLTKLISQYRTHMYDTVDDPEELKSHLVFNEAQYFALKGFYEDEINNKEAEIISLKKNNL